MVEQRTKLIREFVFLTFEGFGKLFVTLRAHWSIKVRSDPNNVAYSGKAIGLHTDLSYYSNPPGVGLFHCIQQFPGDHCSLTGMATRLHDERVFLSARNAKLKKKILKTTKLLHKSISFFTLYLKIKEIISYPNKAIL